MKLLPPRNEALASTQLSEKMSKAVSEWISQIHHGDCIQGMRNLPLGSIDLAFADPPFNIGYDYDVYDDNRAHEDYVSWSNEWISAVYDALSPTGTFWLAIGDEYAAELKIESQKIGFHCRSWVIWYYTFGVNCSKKFTRSHAHLFHFVKDKTDFTFLDVPEDQKTSSVYENRVPSARELVYNDKRANPKGRLPDDTWIIRPANTDGKLTVDEPVDPPQDNDRTFILRPQELEESFGSNEDTWYIPRVAGTFKERAGFHGCQMPEQLLGRIIRICSRPKDVVLDPFSGSATTLAVAKKLGRQYIGFDLSKEYVRHGRKRLKESKVGDRLDGSPEPLKVDINGKPESKGTKEDSKTSRRKAVEDYYRNQQEELTYAGIIEAFQQTHNGYSADRVVADPELNREYVGYCQKIGVAGDAYSLNSLLFKLRKAGRLSAVKTRARTTYSWEDVDAYMFASEIAWQQLIDEKVAKSIDQILCDPTIATQFDQKARQFAPGYEDLEYRWAALKLRKQATIARNQARVLKAPRLGTKILVEDVKRKAVSNENGLYLVSSGSKKLHVGETTNLWERIKLVKNQPIWKSFSDELFVQAVQMDSSTAGPLAWQSRLITKHKTKLNCAKLRAAS